MCIISPTKKGIKNLPKEGTYYKVLYDNGCSTFRSFNYPLCGTIDIPEREQDVEKANGYSAKRAITAGGHFYTKKKDAEWHRRTDERTAVFKIKREDITHIGWSWEYKKNRTVLAKRVRRIK